jgi:hypothetical protein
MKAFKRMLIAAAMALTFGLSARAQQPIIKEVRLGSK